MKIRTSTKIAVSFLLIAALLYGGYQLYVRQAVANLNFDPVVPGEVNLVGIDPGAGYRIVVANEVAQVVQASDDFESTGTSAGGAESGAIKKRIPIKELLGTLRADTDSAGQFTMLMNDIRENEKWPTVHVTWTAEDLRKALDGDKEMEAKLVRDLNVQLDGTPLPSIRPSALENGIMIDFPVKQTVNINGKSQEVVGRVKQPFKPRLLEAVEIKLAEKQVTPEMIAGYYAEEAKKEIDNPELRQDIRAAIDSVISEANAKRLARAPKQIMDGAEVVINQEHIRRARYSTYEAAGKKRHDITIVLTDEGQKRLWKYSVQGKGRHLLLIVDGVAIAAPRIQGELTQDELVIRGLTDEVLVRDAVNRLNKVTE